MYSNISDEGCFIISVCCFVDLPDIAAAVQSFLPCADHTQLSEEPLYCNTDKWRFSTGGKLFFKICVHHNSVLLNLQWMLCVSNVSTKWYETDELTLYLRSRAQETQRVFPPQPTKDKACKGWGLAVVNCIKNLLSLVKNNNHNFFYWRCQMLD